MPSEQQLIADTGLSRVTVRAALDMLARDVARAPTGSHLRRVSIDRNSPASDYARSVLMLA